MLACLPGVAFCCLYVQWQGQRERPGQQGQCSLQSRALRHFQFLLQICRSEKLLFIAEKQESGSLGEGLKHVCPHVPAGGMGSGTAACPGPGGTAMPAARAGVLGVAQLRTSETSGSSGPSEHCLVLVAWPGLSYLLNFAVLPSGYCGLGVYPSPLNSQFH